MQNDNKRLTVGIVGTGGDGVVVLGSFLQRLTASQGYFSQMPRYYGAQIRGGGSAVKLGLDAENPSLPEDEPDILICFSRDKYHEFEGELPLGINTLFIYEKDPPDETNLPERSFKVDFSRISLGTTGSDQNKNIVALGLLTRILALHREQMKVDIEEDTELHLLRENIQALEAGERIFFDLSFPELPLSPPYDTAAKIVLHGNAAVAKGSLYAGCRAFFGYPITPAAEIMQEMEKELLKEGGVFLQAEDEIASSGLAIGASLTGVKTMTSTSGPGFDLMTEMLDLASAAEIPMVVVNVQRCGPSTGIPSKSEQSDLNHAIYGGHGDAPRVAMAPYDIESCYRLAIESFNIAQHFQTPVILLSDQWLGQTFVSVNSGFLKKQYPITSAKRPSNEDSRNYQRYRLTQDLISPMSAVGDKDFTYQTTGLTHNENGSPSFDPEVHQRLHEKRWGKLAALRERDDLVAIYGKEKCSTGIVTWGSSSQAVMETVKHLRLQDKVKVCVPELIHPLPLKVERFLGSIDRLLVIEMNYSGQLYHYLRSQNDLPRETIVYARAGGRSFSRSELSEPIMRIAK